jgi:low affinity Fe/Cu permease
MSRRNEASRKPTFFGAPNTAFERFAGKATRWTGGSLAFMLALGAVLVWTIAGPFFGFSDSWQLVINTGTTLVTFLMVFLIQRSQNKSNDAIQLKLNEIVAVLDGASNRLIGVEDLSQEELKTLHDHYGELVELARKEGSLTKSHSIEEAEARHRRSIAAGESRGARVRKT